MVTRCQYAEWLTIAPLAIFWGLGKPKHAKCLAPLEGLGEHVGCVWGVYRRLPRPANTHTSGPSIVSVIPLHAGALAWC